MCGCLCLISLESFFVIVSLYFRVLESGGLVYNLNKEMWDHYSAVSRSNVSKYGCQLTWLGISVGVCRLLCGTTIKITRMNLPSYGPAYFHTLVYDQPASIEVPFREYTLESQEGVVHCETEIHKICFRMQPSKLYKRASAIGLNGFPPGL